MKTKQVNDKPEKGFYLNVDGHRYGPFLDKHLPKVSRLKILKGIMVETVWLTSGWLSFTPPPVTS